MTKQKSTKRALLLSALSLLMCVSMLIGSTFAWFTDSVTSGNNKIVAGNLDVVLEYKTDWDDDWAIVDENTKIFKEGALYEPGYTEVVFLRVSNAGSLALKYNLMVDIASEKSSINVDGEEFNLSDYLQIGTYTQDEYSSGFNYADFLMPGMFGTREAALAEVSKNVPGVTPLTKLSEADSVVKSDDPILAGEQTAKVMALVLTMPETVGNEANYDAKVAAAPEINLGVSLVATQYTDEKDSFNNQYDKDAEYPLLAETIDPDATLEEIQNLFAEGGSYYVAESMDFTNTQDSSRYTRFTIDNDVKLYAADDAVITIDETLSWLGKGSLTVYGGQLKVKEEFYVDEDFSFVFEGGEHTVGTLTGSGEIIVNGGIINSLANFGGVEGIYLSEDARLVINDGVINLHGCINLSWNNCDNVYVEINGGTINLCEGVDKLFAVRNIMEKDREDGHALRGSSIRINGGVFNTTYELDDTGDANAFIRNEDGDADTTRVLEFNTYNGEKQYDCVVTGGTFYGSWMRTGETGGDGTEVCENTIAGFVADDYEITGDATNGYIVSAK